MFTSYLDILPIEDVQLFNKLKENIQKVKENYTIEDKIIPMLVSKYTIQQRGKSRKALPFQIRNKLNFYINNIPQLRVPINGGYNKTIKNKKKAKTYRKNKKKAKTYRKIKNNKKTKKI